MRLHRPSALEGLGVAVGRQEDDGRSHFGTDGARGVDDVGLQILEPGDTLDASVTIQLEHL